MTDLTKTTITTPQRTSSFGLGAIYLSRRFKAPTQKELKHLFAEIEAHAPTTSEGLPITFRWDGGILRLSIGCTESEYEALMAERTKRYEADERKREDLARLKKQMREVKARDYSDAAAKRSFAVVAMPAKGTPRVQ